MAEKIKKKENIEISEAIEKMINEPFTLADFVGHMWDKRQEKIKKIVESQGFKKTPLIYKPPYGGEFVDVYRHVKVGILIFVADAPVGAIFPERIGEVYEEDIKLYVIPWETLYNIKDIKTNGYLSQVRCVNNAIFLEESADKTEE